MAIEITDLSKLSSATVSAVQEQLRSQLTDLSDGTLDLRRGVFHDLVLHLHAILLTAHNTNLDRYISARSLSAIEADPTLADTETVDAILSNYGVTRTSATVASGVIEIVVNSDTAVTIGAGATFTADGLTFTTEAAYTAKSESSQVLLTTDRLLVPYGASRWIFTVPVVAVVAGSSGNITKGTILTPAAPPTTFVTAYAMSDFTGGIDAETNAELISKLKLGMAAKVPSNRVTFTALQQSVSSFTASSIIGVGDAEMRRDRHTLWPSSTGGRVDWYVRTQASPASTTLNVTARLISKTDISGVWAFTLTDEFPGFYEVRSILPVGTTAQGTLTLLSDDRSIGTTSTNDPDIVDAVEAVYTPYQTAVITFSDTLTNHSELSVGAEAAYAVTVTGMPRLADLQTAAASYDRRPLASDVLVKAPIPCFVRVSLVINKSSAQVAPDTAAIKAAITSAVHATPFTGRLPASSVYKAVSPYLSDNMGIGQLLMSGRIRKPDGSATYINNNVELVVPSDPEDMVSEKTVQFFTDNASIEISTSDVVPAQV